VSDALPLDNARILGGNHDPRGWRIFDEIESVTMGGQFEAGDIMVKFRNNSVLNMPDAIGSQGPITWTLWFGHVINTNLYIAAGVECHKGHYIPTGRLMDPRQFADNIWYQRYMGGTPLEGYQPQPGELILVFATTGDTRRQQVQAEGIEPGRTYAVLVPWKAGTYTFNAEPAQPSQPTQPTQPATPTTPTTQVPASSELLDELKKQTALLQTIATNTTNLRGDIVRVDKAWIARFAAAAKVIPGLGGIFK